MNRWITSFVLMVLMLISAFASSVLTPSQKLSQKRETIDLEQAVPKAFGSWSIDASAIPILPSADTQEAVAKIYDQTLNRTYINKEGVRIMLSIAYGGTQNNQLRAHRQEVCYAAQGFQISKLSQIDLQFGKSTISGTRMVAQQGQQRIEPVTYWFTMGDEVVRSYLDRQVTQLKYAFSGLIPDGYLYRVSSLSSDPYSAFKKQEQFTVELLQAVDPQLAQRLLGRGA